MMVEQPPNEILETDGSIPVGTVVNAVKGDVIVRQPLGRPNLKSANSDIMINYKGKLVTIGRDGQLIPSQVVGSATQSLMYRYRFYCTSARPTGKKRIVGMSELGSVGMDLDKIAKLRFGQTQNCVVDSNGDGAVDLGAIVDTGDREPLVPVPITPTTMRDNGFQKMPGESEARIVFDGVGGLLSSLSFSMEIIEEGRRLPFSNGQVILPTRNLPRTVQIAGGAEITVLAYDPTSKAVQVRLDRGFSGGPYGVEATIRRRY